MYFAKLDAFNVVLKVIVADQEFIDTQPGTWIPADINGVSPKNYPGIGYKYNADLVAFIAPKPYPSWELDENCKWQAPTPIPDDGEAYIWNEDTLTWELDE